jgi:hypothetical protein
MTGRLVSSLSSSSDDDSSCSTILSTSSSCSTPSWLDTTSSSSTWIEHVQPQHPQQQRQPKRSMKNNKVDATTTNENLPHSGMMDPHYDNFGKSVVWVSLHDTDVMSLSMKRQKQKRVIRIKHRRRYVAILHGLFIFGISLVLIMPFYLAFYFIVPVMKQKQRQQQQERKQSISFRPELSLHQPMIRSMDAIGLTRKKSN